MDAKRTHFLKTWPEHFQAVMSGAKTFELRKNDRNFQVGDRLELAEFDPEVGHFTGREHDVDVTHILQGGPFGLPETHVIMSIRPPPSAPVEAVAWRESLKRSPAIEELTPTNREWTACVSVQDQYDLMKHKVDAAFSLVAAPPPSAPARAACSGQLGTRS